MKSTQIAADSWVFVGQAFESAVTVLADGERLLLVDSFASDEDALEMLRYLGRTAGQVSTVVATHFMSDHIGGLHLFPNAQIIAHRNYRHAYFSQNGRVDQAYVEPTMLFDTQLEVRWGRFTLKLLYNPGKTMDHIAVDVQQADLACAGDNIVGNIVYLAKADPRQIDEAISRVQQLGRSWVVSAHCGRFPATALGNARFYLDCLRSEVIAIRKDNPENTARRIRSIDIADCIAPGVVPSEFERQWHANNLAVIEREATFSLDAVHEYPRSVCAN